VELFERSLPKPETRARGCMRGRRWCRCQPQDRRSRHSPISKLCQILSTIRVYLRYPWPLPCRLGRETDALLVTTAPTVRLLSHTYHTLPVYPPARGLSSEPDVVEIFIDPSRFLTQLGISFCSGTDPTLACSVPMPPADPGNLQRGLRLFMKGRHCSPWVLSLPSRSLLSFLPSSSFSQLDRAVSGDPSEDRSGIAWFNTSTSSAPSQFKTLLGLSHPNPHHPVVPLLPNISQVIPS